MRVFSNHDRYGAVAQFFHWLTVFLVGTAYILSEGGSEQRLYSATPNLTLQIHETFGMAVVAIVLLRLLWRLIDSVPEDPPMASWMKYSAKIVHLALYVLIISTPVVGILGAWLEGHPVMLVGIGNFGPMLPQAHAAGQLLSEFHTILGNAVIWVAGLHAAAALFHHYALRDNVLVSMLPWTRHSP